MKAGVDVVAVDRIAGVLARRRGFLARVFTAGELADCGRGGVALDSQVAVARLAGRFAAKEATRKALGDRALPWREVEVVTADDGAPSLRVRGRPSTLTVSLAHDAGVAVAVVVGASDDAG